MKKYMLVVLFLLLATLPLNGLVSSGIKGGVDMQMFGNGNKETEWWSSFGMLAEFNLPVLPIAFRGEAGYAWHSENAITSSDLNIIISAKYSISPPLSPLGFYLGAGPGFHILKTGDLESENYFGVHIYTGLNLRMGVNLFVEGGYGIIFPEDGSWNQFNIKLGVML
ncbi:MAG: outer membrane beta-barrel protein [Candidatus Bathyarchaeota archaeon]|nr:outer membrane beta-barrel protein [Candidatus Bathyarchaeota archaeon]